jgi:hypothetical protein
MPVIPVVEYTVNDSEPKACILDQLSPEDFCHACDAHACLIACHRGACKNDSSMGQVIATARGVQPASIRLGWVWWLRPTAHGAWLASTSLDQVCAYDLLASRPPPVERIPCTTLCFLSVLGSNGEAEPVLRSQSQRDRDKYRDGLDTIDPPAESRET